MGVKVEVVTPQTQNSSQQQRLILPTEVVPDRPDLDVKGSIVADGTYFYDSGSAYECYRNRNGEYEIQLLQDELQKHRRYWAICRSGNVRDGKLIYDTLWNIRSANVADENVQTPTKVAGWH